MGIYEQESKGFVIKYAICNYLSPVHCSDNVFYHIGEEIDMYNFTNLTIMDFANGGYDFLFLRNIICRDIVRLRSGT